MKLNYQSGKYYENKNQSDIVLFPKTVSVLISKQSLRQL